AFSCSAFAGELRVRYPSEIEMTPDKNFFAVYGENNELKKPAVEVLAKVASKFRSYRYRDYLPKDPNIAFGINSAQFVDSAAKKLLVSFSSQFAFALVDLENDRDVCMPALAGHGHAMLSSDKNKIAVVRNGTVSIFDIISCRLDKEIAWEPIKAYPPAKIIEFNSGTGEVSFLETFSKDYSTVANLVHLSTTSGQSIKHNLSIQDYLDNLFGVLRKDPKTDSFWIFNASDSFALTHFASHDAAQISRDTFEIADTRYTNGYSFEIVPELDRLLIATGWSIAVYEKSTGKRLFYDSSAGCTIFNTGSCNMWEAQGARFIDDSTILVVGDNGFGFMNVNQ
ncbi:MAG: hypothetical protein NTV34_11680, partial [Proteobacteria bacterium]|nr:hypothetical protein [Pseudomonadota bacterium]